MSPIHKASLIEASFHSKEVLQLLDLDINRALVGEFFYLSNRSRSRVLIRIFLIRPFGPRDHGSSRSRSWPTHHLPWQVRPALPRAPRLCGVHRESPIHRGSEDAHHPGDSRLYPPLQTPPLNRNRRLGSPPRLPRSPHPRLQIHQRFDPQEQSLGDRHRSLRKTGHRSCRARVPRRTRLGTRRFRIGHSRFT